MAIDLVQVIVEHWGVLDKAFVQRHRLRRRRMKKRRRRRRKYIVTPSIQLISTL